MVLINGIQQDSIPITDRGLQYGDGVFETVSVINGTPRLLDRHLQRLESSCNRLMIPYPGSRLIKDEIERFCNSEKSRFILKIIITRGSGGRGYRPADEPHPTRILSSHPWPSYPAEWSTEGIQARLCKHRLSRNPVLAGIKHLNRLDQVLASMEWDDPGIAEGIMLDTDGNLVEGTRTNIFMIKDENLYTPRLEHCGVNGIMRNLLIEIAGINGIIVYEDNLEMDDLFKADEVFMCNSVIGLWPVKSIDKHAFKTPFPVCDKLKKLLATYQGFMLEQTVQGIE